MAIVIEDGSGTNSAANSYKSVDDLRSYASMRGIDLSAETDEALEVLLIKAMDYLESLRYRYKGYPGNRNQPLQWPRADVWDVVWPGCLSESDEIPRELEYAQLALAIEARGYDLLPTRPANAQGPITKKRIEGAVEIAYANPGTVNHVSAFAKADALLAPLLKRNGLTLVRS